MTPDALLDKTVPPDSMDANRSMPMNEQNPGATLFKDRSTGLVVFGILTIMLGCLSGLLVPLVLLGQVMAATTTNVPVNYEAMLPGMVIYGVLAVALVWMGIGSIRAQRWARALLLVFSWSWLGLGVFEMIAMAIIMPKAMGNLPATGTTGQPVSPAAVMDGVLLVMFLVFGVIFIILPGIWTFFYNSPHVKATCDARDPVANWTDACPLPVLGLCLWLWFTVPMLLIMPVAAHGVMPFFGMFLTGVPGVLFGLGLAALWGYCSWLLYRLDRRGWWLFFFAICAGLASTVLTFARHNILEMYRLMDYPEAQIEQIQKTGLLEGNWMIYLMLCSTLPFLGYLFFIKRYFRGKS